VHFKTRRISCLLVVGPHYAIFSIVLIFFSYTVYQNRDVNEGNLRKGILNRSPSFALYVVTFAILTATDYSGSLL
jgi:hypothetical protein